MVGNKLLTSIKLVLLGILSLLWFVFIQVEYEIVTKPELQNDVPIIKGIYAVYFIGFILLVTSVVIVSLGRSLLRELKSYDSS